MTTPVCKRCQTSQSTLPSALKRCARCQMAQYCSVACQRADWPEHKSDCARLSRILNSNAEATVKLRIAEMSTPEHETVFYIRRSTPHLDDMAVSGPFYPRHSILEQMKANLQKISLLGMSAVLEIEEDEAKLSRLASLSAPLDANLSQVVHIEIIEQHNPVLASRLPCPVYNVVTGTPLVAKAMAALSAGRGSNMYPPVSAMDICGSYLTLDEAKTKADQLTRDFERTLSRPRSTEMPGATGGAFDRMVFGKDRRGEVQALSVQVRYDSGQIAWT